MGGIAKTSKGRRRKVGSTFTKKITRGANKGDTVRFQVAPSGKPFPVKVVRDVGGGSTVKADVRGNKKRRKKK